MALSDEQVGWLWPAFMLVYMVTAPAFGAWGDRGSRRRPIAIGVFIWSLATVLSGLARSYPQLLGARALVGIGEAAYVAIAPALLADCFPVSARGRVYSVLNMAIPVGAALGYVLGGLIGQRAGWRDAFFICGAPGALLAAAVLLIPDPPRGVQEPAPAAPSTPVGGAPRTCCWCWVTRPIRSGSGDSGSGCPYSSSACAGCRRSRPRAILGWWWCSRASSARCSAAGWAIIA
jgi:MFS family permease